MNLQESIRRILREELHNVPQAGESSGKPMSTENLDCQTEYLTIDQILDGKIKSIPYYKEVLQDIENNDYTWSVTKKVLEYAEYMKEHPESLKNLPTIIVLNGKLQDGAHRISAVNLLNQHMDKDNPMWDKIKLKVKFCNKP